MNSVEEDALLASRRASSACKKGMFSDEEGRLLVVYSAFSQKKKGTIYKIS